MEHNPLDPPPLLRLSHTQDLFLLTALAEARQGFLLIWTEMI
jgi:hypothetical protein